MLQGFLKTLSAEVMTCTRYAGTVYVWGIAEAVKKSRHAEGNTVAAAW